MPNIDVLNGFNIIGQFPLDSRGYASTIVDLQDLGTNSFKPFRYYDGLRVFVEETKKLYIWKENLSEAGKVPILAEDYIYPIGSIANGVDYSGKSYNFFLFLDKYIVGLNEVDNVSDVDKPVSDAAQIEFNLRAPIESPTFTGTVGGVTKAMVGLSEVDNTSDLAKPTSTITQGKLDTHTNEIVGLVQGQTGGLKVFTTYALMEAYATPNVLDSYKVTNDTTPANNGYHHWTGTGIIYEKDIVLDTAKIGIWLEQEYILDSQVNHLGKDWVSNAATLSTDVPGTSSKWVERLSGYAEIIPITSKFNAIVNSSFIEGVVTQTNYYLSATGTFVSSVNWRLSNFIDVYEGQIVTYYGNTSSSSLVMCLAGYNSSNVYVQTLIGSEDNNLGKQIIIPAGVTKIVGCSFNTAVFSILVDTNILKATDDIIVQETGARVANEKSLFDFTSKYINLFNPLNVVSGSFVNNTTGNITANAGFLRTLAIPIKPSTTYTLYGSKLIVLSYYKSDILQASNWLGKDLGTVIDGNAIYFTTPANCTHIAFNLSDIANDWEGSKSKCMLTEGNKRIGYLPYERVINDHKITNVNIVSNLNTIFTPSFLTNLPENGEILFLQTGQSNATEQALCSPAPLSQLGTYSSLRTWNNTTSQWDLYTKYYTNACNFNLALATLINQYNKEIKVVNYSVSATAISQHLTGGSVYPTFLAHVTNAINEVIGRGKIPYVYLLFVQGEADSNNISTSDAYAVNQQTWIDLWRGHLGQVPIILSTIYEKGTALEIGRDKQVNDAKRLLKKNGTIQGIYEVQNYPTNDDLHRNYSGYQLEGAAILRQLINIRQGLEITSTLPYNY